MDDVRIGVLTRYVLLAGLVAFIVLSFVPRFGLASLYVTTITPIAAAAITGVELIIRNKRAAGISLLASVAVIVVGVLWGIR